MQLQLFGRIGDGEDLRTNWGGFKNQPYSLHFITLQY